MAVLPVGIGPVTGYNIERSLRFNSADSAYLNRTFSTPTNNLKWTWSGWVKRSAAADVTLFSQGIGATNTYAHLYYTSTGELNFRQINGSGTTVAAKTTSAVYRDYSAWYHVILVYDSANATSTNRLLLYVNGVQVTAFSTSTDPSLSLASYINSAEVHRISSVQYSPVLYYFDGYLTEVNFIDGSALTPSSFGETDPSTGVWRPKKYTGTYGTNGFYLNFSDNSNTTSTTLGKDSSGNGNNWTPNNFSVTAGAGNDSLVDTPTPYGTDTGAGGEVRGNYATLNPVVPSSLTPSDGNLRTIIGTTEAGTTSTIAVPSGVKAYAEMTFATTTSASVGAYIGAAGLTANMATVSYSRTNVWCMIAVSNRQLWSSGTNTSTLAGTIANTVTLQVAIDNESSGANTYIWIGENNVWYNSSLGTTGNPSTGANPTFTISKQDLYFYFAGFQNTLNMNFGQRAFNYTAPSGFKALCTQNLPTPTIGATSTTQANDYFNAVTYTGDTNASTVITGVGFQPDFVWIKNRSNTGGTGVADHMLYDAVRGTLKNLSSNLTDAEGSLSTGLSAFNTDGFTPGTATRTNETGNTYVAWNWKANGAGSSNTAGTITSTVSANTTAGFSIVTYTGTGSNATVGHGLGVAPKMVIVRNRLVADNWQVYHSSLTSAAYRIVLNLTNAQDSQPTMWNSSATTSTVFNIGTSTAVNDNTKTYVAYCFAEVAGYSAFGSYTGNGSTDGPMIFTGFRPRYVMIKRTDSTGGWVIFDSARDDYNVMTKELAANGSAAEASPFSQKDFLSNGFKIRNTQADHNANTATYVYMALAETPLKFALAR